MSVTPSDIVTYLASIKSAKITRILPCYVTIGKQTYPAARYTECWMTPQGTAAWNRGEREYEREMIYCVGFLPTVKLRGSVAFTLEGRISEHGWSGDADEWYVAGYYGTVKGRKQDKAEPSEYHPFGNSFLLAPWHMSDGLKIDHYARVPYRRVVAHVGL
jgi:hypothetical protein